jgi:hypothetical protein
MKKENIIQGAVAMLTQFHVGCCGMPLLLSSLQMTNTAASPSQNLPYLLAPVTAIGLTWYESVKAKSCTSLCHNHHHNPVKSVCDKTLLAWGLTALMTATGLTTKDNHIIGQSARGWSNNEKTILYAHKEDELWPRFFIGNAKANNSEKINVREVSFIQATYEAAEMPFKKDIKSISGHIGLNAMDMIRMKRTPPAETLQEKLTETVNNLIAFNNRKNLKFRTAESNL